MRIMFRPSSFLFALAALVLLAATAGAQPLTPGQLAPGLATRPDLALLAVNRPDELEGALVVDAEGRERGRVQQVARLRADGVIVVLVDTGAATQAALPLEALTLAAFAFWDPSRPTVDPDYEPAAFTTLVTAQAGHSAQGALPRPADPGAPAADEPLAPAAADAAPYPVTSAPVPQLALLDADALEGKLLVDAVGKPLGQIGEIVRGNADGLLYGVLEPALGSTRKAVPLDALTIAVLALAADAPALDGASGEAADFEVLERR